VKCSPSAPKRWSWQCLGFIGGCPSEHLPEHLLCDRQALPPAVHVNVCRLQNVSSGDVLMKTHLVLAERHQRCSRQSMFIAGDRNISLKTRQVLAGRCPALWTAVCGRACTPGRQDALLTACVHSAEQGRRQRGAHRDARRAQADWELVADLHNNALCQREGAAVQSCGRHLLHRQPHCAPSMLSVFKQQYIDFKSRPSALHKGVLSNHTAAPTRSPFNSTEAGV